MRIDRLCLVLALSVAAARTAAPQGLSFQPGTTVGGPAIDTALGARYRGSTLRRLLFGNGYRELWATPVRVEMLDLAAFAGGLRPLQAGNQTRSLRFLGADGREYVLRAADKVAAYAVAPELRGTLVEDIVQDQVSASHPFSAAVADRLEAAAGLAPLHPRLVILSDDPALGDFREEFAGMIGYIQARPEEGPDRSPGFAGFRRVIGTDALLRRRRERPEEVVDVRRFLTARLVDLLLGDWDRHRDQWRWGRTHSDCSWQPIPRDHDWAFGRYEGLVLSYMRRSHHPHLVRFRPGRLPVPGLTWFGRDLDRELLSRLEWAVWDSVVGEVRARLDDDVLAEAVEAMPAEVPRLHRAWLAETLRNRRAHLADAARRFYQDLTREADLHATDAPERIVIEGMPDGAVRVEVSGDSAGTGIVRRFDPSETRELRLYAHRGADTVITRGRPGRIRVRVIGGGGRDVLMRDGGPRIDFHQGGEAWRPLPSEGDEPPPRDWGGRTVTLPYVAASSEAGMIVGLDVTHVDYGFRKLPFASRTSVRAVFGTANARPGMHLSSLVLTARPWLRFALDAGAGGAEVLRFYQLGNESEEAADRRFHRVRNWQVSLAPVVELVPANGLVLGAGPTLRYVDSELDPDRLIGAVRPYGSAGFGTLGARAYLRRDTRDVPANPRRGWLLEVGGNFTAGVWDAEESFGGAHAVASTSFGAGGEAGPRLALRAGGQRVWGRYPYFEAARVGGAATLRGYSEGRFLGDAAVFTSAEVRLPLRRATLLLPGTLGVLGFGDAGRVFLEGESSRDWHKAFGGGVWFAALGPANVVSVTLARSPERTTLGLRGGMAF